jgi:hypothetical protein
VGQPHMNAQELTDTADRFTASQFGNGPQKGLFLRRRRSGASGFLSFPSRIHVGR